MTANAQLAVFFDFVVVQLPDMLKLVGHTQWIKRVYGWLFSGRNMGENKCQTKEVVHFPTCHSLQTDRRSPFGPYA